MKIYITNLGKYVEGYLIGKWVQLPIDEDALEKVLEAIGIDDYYEEFFITDYETEIVGVGNSIGEYSSLAELNRLAERLEDLCQSDADKLEAVLEYTSCRGVIWTLEEYQKFSEVMQDKPMFFYAFEVLYWSGLRLGELLGLTKDDVSLEDGTLKVARSYKTQVHKDGKTKTVTSKRTVHIPQNLVDELAEYMETLYGLSGTDKLFPTSKTTLHKRLKEGANQVGLDKITIHGFRHSHISMIMNDVQCASVMDIAKRAGHKKPTTTMIYTHRYKSKDEMIANELNKLMMGERGNVSEEL